MSMTDRQIRVLSAQIVKALAPMIRQAFSVPQEQPITHAELRQFFKFGEINKQTNEVKP